MRKLLNRRKGITIVSEALLSIGIILVAVAFVFVGGNIVNLQSEGLFGSAQNQMGNEIGSVIRGLPDSSGTYSSTYKAELSSYTLSVEDNSVVNVEVPGQSTSSRIFTGFRLENNRISDSEAICISRTGSNVSITAGGCDNSSMSNFCTNGRCINGVCQVNMGETCSNSGGDCACSPNSDCETGYKAEDYIDASGSGDDELDTNEKGCVLPRFVGAQGSEEDKCDYDFECSTSLTCTDHGGSSPGRCCPSGEYWNGTACTASYTIVAVPIKYNFPSEKSQYESKADQFEEFWERESVFRTCDSPSTSVDVKTLDSSCSNNVESACQGNFCSQNCANEIIQCASNNYPNFDKAEGLYNGPGMSMGGGTVVGCAGKANLRGSSQGSLNGGALHITGLGFESGKGSAHELGHDFGLCHGKSDGSWSNPSVKPCKLSDSGCEVICRDSDGDGDTSECTKTGDTCSGSECVSTTEGTCIGCTSSYCPNNDPKDPKDIMNYQDVTPNTKYKFKTQEDQHISSFSAVDQVLDACK